MDTKFVISLADLTAGMTFNGGGVLKIVNPDNGVSLSFDMTESNVVTLPSGVWDMYFVGFEGATSWTGPHKCGVTKKVNLIQSGQIVDIVVNTANCSGSEYVSMINSKNPNSNVAAKWDQENWDSTATWGP